MVASGNPDPNCVLRGCLRDGEYYLKRMTKTGRFQNGLYCDEHERRFGGENLKVCAREVNGRVGMMADEEGQFDAVLV